MSTISREDIPKDSLQGSATLHSFRWCHLDCSWVHTRIGVIVDYLRSSFPLRHTAQGRDLKGLEVMDSIIRQDYEHAFRLHVSHFSCDEL